MTFNKSLFRAVLPGTLREFSVRVLNKPLPSITERAQWWKDYHLDLETEYLGSDAQNQALLDALYKEAGL